MSENDGQKHILNMTSEPWAPEPPPRPGIRGGLFAGTNQGPGTVLAATQRVISSPGGDFALDITEIVVEPRAEGGENESCGPKRRLKRRFRTVDEAREFIRNLTDKSSALDVSLQDGDLLNVLYDRSEIAGIAGQTTYRGAVFEPKAVAWLPIGVKRPKSYKRWRFDIENA